MSVIYDFNADDILNKIGSGQGYLKLKLTLANEVITVTDPYVPFDKGFLKNSTSIAPNGSYFTYGSRGQSNKYARRLYYNPQYNFKGAPMRGGRWVERSLVVNGQAIEKSLQAMANRGLFK